MSGRPRKPELTKVVRDAMLDAATSVFARKGYSAATMNEIAAAAGYTAPAFYKYFKGKKELFEALLERTNAEVRALLPKVGTLAGLSFEERVERLFRAGFELVDRRAEMFAVITAIQTSTAALPSAEIAKRQLAEARQSRKRLAAWLAETVGSDRLGAVDVDQAAAFFAVVGRGLYVQWAAERVQRGERAAGQFVDRVPLALHLFLYGVRGVPERKRQGAAATKPRSRRAVHAR